MMNKILSYFKRYSPGIISGVLVGTSYIPFPPWAILFCYLPLWYAVVQNPNELRKNFVMAWWTQFVLTLIGFHWIAYVSYVFGYMPWPLAGGVLLLFAACVHLYIPLAIVVSSYCRKRWRLSAGEQLCLL